MHAGLSGRVTALERQADQAAGCPDCGGALVVGVQDGEPAPVWLGHESRCRCCGNGVKLYRQRELDKLA